MNKYHLLALHMHQPPDNLLELLDSSKTNKREKGIKIIKSYERPLRFINEAGPKARLALAFSGSLLDQLLDGDVQNHVKRLCDIDLQKILDEYRNHDQIEFLGTAYYHPPLPIIPPADCSWHIGEGRKRVQEVFGKEPKIFFPPYLALCPEQLYKIEDCGYQAVIIEASNLAAKESMDYKELIYRPHKIVNTNLQAIPRSRDLSLAQRNGFDPQWLNDQIEWIFKGLTEQYLICTLTDGENGEWFRQTEEDAGFWGFFYRPYMQRIEHGDYPLKPVNGSEYLNLYLAEDKVEIQCGSNEEAIQSSSDGEVTSDFSRWVGTLTQRRALIEIEQLSAAVEAVKDGFTESSLPPTLWHQAKTSLCKAETGCFLFHRHDWKWIHRIYELTNDVREQLLDLLKDWPDDKPIPKELVWLKQISDNVWKRAHESEFECAKLRDAEGPYDGLNVQEWGEQIPHERQRAFEELLRIQTELLKEEQNFAWLEWGRVGILTILGRVEEAEEAAERTVSLDPSIAWADPMLRRVLLNFDPEEDSLEAASCACEKLLQLRTNDPDALLDLGLILCLQGNYKKAISILEDLVTREPNKLWGYAELGEAQRLAGFVDEALISFSEVISKANATDNIEDLEVKLWSQWSRAALYYDTDRLEKAIKDIYDILDIDEDDSWNLELAGKVFHSCGEYDCAVRLWDYIPNKDEDPDILTLQAFSCLYLDDENSLLDSFEQSRKAITLYEKLGYGKASKEILKVRRIKAEALLHLNKTSEAYQEFQDIITNFRGHQHRSSAFNWNLGKCYYRLGDSENAFKYFNESKRADRLNKGLGFDIALTIACSGNLESAQLLIQQTLSQLKDDDRLYRRGLIRMAIIDFESAAPEQPELQQDPKFMQIKELLTNEWISLNTPKKHCPFEE